MTASFASQLWTLSQSGQITAKTHLTLRALASFVGHRGLFPSHESIAARAGASVRTVIRALERAYELGIVERTRQRIRRSGRLVNGPNRYRLVLVDMEQARVAAAHATQKLREALTRRKERFFLTAKMAADPIFRVKIIHLRPTPRKNTD